MGRSEKEEVKDYMKLDEEGRLVPDYERTIKIFDEGDIVSGTVVRVDRDEVLVDIGYKSEGAIPVRELSIKTNVDPFEVVSVGDEIEALVLQKEDKEGRLILSKKRAEYERAWDEIERIREEGGTVKGKVIEVVKGGLILNIGLRGFLPASLVELRRVKDLDDYVGQDLECKIIEINRGRNNVVLSRRAILEEKHREERREILARLEKGQILTGKISSVVDFGAFVDLGGVDGLIHISELSWTRINHPSEVVSVGDEVKVQVLDVDMERERVSLGLRQTQEDPWREQVSKYSVGDVIKGSVSKLVSFGAFVEIGEGVEGLMHVSELSDERVESPEEVVRVGEEVEARIIDIDLDRRRVNLTLRKAEEKKELEKKPEEKPEGKVEEKVETKEKAKAKVKEKAEEKEVAVKVEEAEEKVMELKEASEEAIEEESEKEILPEPTSLEAVLEEMKKTRGRKKKT